MEKFNIDNYDASLYTRVHVELHREKLHKYFTDSEFKHLCLYYSQTYKLYKEFNSKLHTMYDNELIYYLKNEILNDKPVQESVKL